MPEIALKDGHVALVSQEDHAYLSKWKWQLDRDGYAVRHDRKGQRWLGMHVAVAERMGEVGPMIDHQDRNRLNNQRDNLRAVNPRESAWNRRRGGCEFVGVSPFKGRFVARLHLDGEQIYIGTYDLKRHAALAVDREVRLRDLPIREEFLNFPGVTDYSEIPAPRRRKKACPYIGVSPVGKKFRAQIHNGVKTIDLGMFPTAIAAAHAYDKKARELGKKRLNFREPVAA